MDRRAVAVTSLVGAGGVAICLADVRAYRRLGAIAQELRAAQPPATVQSSGTGRESTSRIAGAS